MASYKEGKNAAQFEAVRLVGQSEPGADTICPGGGSEPS